MGGPAISPVDPRDTPINFLDHLDELRHRLLKSVVALVLGLIVGWFVAPYPLDLMTLPLARALSDVQQAPSTLSLTVEEDGTTKIRHVEELFLLNESKVTPHLRFYRPNDEKPFLEMAPKAKPVLHYLKPMDSFVVRFKAALVVGLVIIMPFLLYQLWAFIEPGLLENERKLAFPMILTGTILFPTGAVFAYFLLEVTLRFFAEFFIANATPLYDARAYLGFALTMMLSFGAIFELPLVVVLATRTGLVTVEWLAERRKYIFIGLLITAAIITPSGDPFTLMALSAPLYGLFEGALLVSKILDRVAIRRAEEEKDEEEERDRAETED